VSLALGRALVLTEPPNPHEPIVARGGARKRHPLGLGGEQAQAQAPTRRFGTVAWSTGHGHDAIERLHGLIPGEVVPHHQECPAMGACQEFRVIDNARLSV
jgi:hypothetical protein